MTHSINLKKTSQIMIANITISKGIKKYMIAMKKTSGMMITMMTMARISMKTIVNMTNSLKRTQSIILMNRSSTNWIKTKITWTRISI